jgi:hypothetical protein
MVKKEAEEEAEKTNSAITTHSLPPPPPETEQSEEIETLRSKVRYRWQSKVHVSGLVHLVMPTACFIALMNCTEIEPGESWLVLRPCLPGMNKATKAL